MSIDFESETMEITGKLKLVEGYLDCEKIIIHNIKKQLDKGCNDEIIVKYLKKLTAFFSDKIAIIQHHGSCTNYRFAAGFVDTLLKMPYWKSWMKTIDM